MKIDAHQHFWKFDPSIHEWIHEDMSVIRNDFFPADLQPLLAENHFDGSIAVQVEQSENETLSLVKLAKENSFIRGVVGWVDLMSPDIRDRLDALAQHKAIKGFRHIVQGQPNGFLLQPSFLTGISALHEFGFTYDLLVYPNQLQEAISFVEQLPDQKFVIDHLAKPFIKKGILQPWIKQITQLACFENVYCKLSGMITEADWQNWKAADFTPYLDAVLNGFGAKRVFYGSDWPVCLVAATYSQQLAIIEDYINHLSPDEKSGIMGKNAVQFYNI